MGDLPLPRPCVKSKFFNFQSFLNRYFKLAVIKPIKYIYSKLQKSCKNSDNLKLNLIKYKNKISPKFMRGNKQRKILINSEK